LLSTLTAIVKGAVSEPSDSLLRLSLSCIFIATHSDFTHIGLRITFAYWAKLYMKFFEAF
ncbi:hypothetical protein, partial [Duncaniella muris]|uniref:hypothetical protein n=1 Tax=Duncaniella muris TaxID=2094150 RepID=UPI002714C483